MNSSDNLISSDDENHLPSLPSKAIAGPHAPILKNANQGVSATSDNMDMEDEDLNEYQQKVQLDVSTQLEENDNSGQADEEDEEDDFESNEALMDPNHVWNYDDYNSVFILNLPLNFPPLPGSNAAIDATCSRCALQAID